MIKNLYLIIMIIFAPTCLFSETVTIYASQSASYYASDCCSVNSIGFNNNNTLSAADCIYWSYYDACETSTKYPIWSFDFIELSPTDTVLSVSFQAEAVYDEWHDSYMAISSQTGVITTSMGSDLASGGDWSIDNQTWTWWNQGLNIYQELPVSGIQLAIDSGQLNIAVHEYLGSIVNYGTNAPKLVIEYEPATFPLLGDINDDNILNVIDLMQLINLILSNDEIYIEIADINFDSKINVFDLNHLIEII